jgi:hypothetical protein
VAPKVGSGRVCVWRESGVRRSVFMLVRLAGIWLQSPLRCFPFNLPLKKFHKFCTFNAICKDNAAYYC